MANGSSSNLAQFYSAAAACFTSMVGISIQTMFSTLSVLKVICIWQLLSRSFIWIRNPKFRQSLCQAQYEKLPLYTINCHPRHHEHVPRRLHAHIHRRLNSNVTQQHTNRSTIRTKGRWNKERASAAVTNLRRISFAITALSPAISARTLGKGFIRGKGRRYSTRAEGRSASSATECRS